MKKHTRETIREEDVVREPEITYDRTLNLTAYDGGVRLSHLRELMAKAVDHGFTSDAKVKVSDGGSFMSRYQHVTISEDK